VNTLTEDGTYIVDARMGYSWLWPSSLEQRVITPKMIKELKTPESWWWGKETGAQFKKRVPSEEKMLPKKNTMQFFDKKDEEPNTEEGLRLYELE
jgi:hypothetical protein